MEYITKIKLLLQSLENNIDLHNSGFIAAMNTGIQQLEDHINKLNVVKITSTSTSSLFNINYNQLELLGNSHKSE